MVRIVIGGALGRMGKSISELGENDPDIKVVGGVELESVPERNIVSDIRKIKGPYDCIIEFTSSKVTMEHLARAVEMGKPVVIGTTGFTGEEIEEIKKASRKIPILLSPNMSVGVNILFALIQKAASLFGNEYKIRIKETHHVHKKDKPSGTAKLMKNIAEERSGLKDIPVESVREDEVVGDHDIIFESGVDVLKITHNAKTRGIFALGALRGAKFIVTKKKGLFSMADVLGM